MSAASDLVDWIVDTLETLPELTRLAFPGDEIAFVALRPGEQLDLMSRQAGVFSVAEIRDAQAVGAGKGGRPLAYLVEGLVIIRTADTGADPHQTLPAAATYGQACIHALSVGGWQHLAGAPVRTFSARDFTTVTVPAVDELRIEQHHQTTVRFVAHLRADGA